jgi:hypothetical protein
MSATLTPDRRATRFHAERVACLAMALCAGRSPEQVAAEIASRVINSLRSKPSTPSRP